jgi:hypothetical protein
MAEGVVVASEARQSHELDSKHSRSTILLRSCSTSRHEAEASYYILTFEFGLGFGLEDFLASASLLANNVQPRKVVFTAGNNRQSDDFGHFITVYSFYHLDYFGKKRCSGFCQQ